MRKGEERSMIEDLSNKSDDLSQWEQEFLESIERQLDNGGKLSERQTGKLVDMYEKKVLGY